MQGGCKPVPLRDERGAKPGAARSAEQRRTATQIRQELNGGLLVWKLMNTTLVESEAPCNIMDYDVIKDFSLGDVHILHQHN